MAYLIINYASSLGSGKDIKEHLLSEMSSLDTLARSSDRWTRDKVEGFVYQFRSAIKGEDYGIIETYTRNLETILSIRDSEEEHNFEQEDVEIRKRYWAAGTNYLATDMLKIFLSGREIGGKDGYPFSIMIENDTTGARDDLSLMERQVWRGHGPEGEPVNEYEYETQRANFETAMYETACGLLHLWHDLFGSLTPVTEGIVSVQFIAQEGFDMSITPDAAVEVGRDKSIGTDENFERQVRKLLDGGAISDIANPVY